MTNARSAIRFGQGIRRVGTPPVTSFEFDYPERFVQEQVGHTYASTTAIYTSVSDAYRNTLLRRALAARNPDLWEQT